MIHRVVHNRDNPYFQLNRAVLKDVRISWKAAGILAYLMSKPDNWIIREEDLVRQHTDGRDAVRSGLRELREVGYIVKKQVRTDDGRYSHTEAHVYEIPTQCDEPWNGEVDGSLDSPLPGNPPAVDPLAVYPPHNEEGIVEKKKNTLSANGSSSSSKPKHRSDSTREVPGFSLSGESSPKEITRTRKMVNKFYDELARKGQFAGRPKPNLDKWDRDVKLCIQETEITLEELESIADWYVGHIHDEFMPEVYSINGLREKYVKLQNARRRLEREVSRESGNSGPDETGYDPNNVQAVMSDRKLTDEEYRDLIEG